MTAGDPWDAAVLPQCPESCCWRETCSSDIQAGIASLWRSGRITTPTDCTFHEHRSRVHKAATGFDAPGSVEELRAQLATHKPAGPA